MKTSRSTLVLFSLALLVPAGILGYYQSRCPLFAARIVHQVLLRVYAPGQEAEFHEVMQAHGRGPRGAEADMYRFRCSDCVEVERIHLRFPTVDDAANEMTIRIDEARRVIERSGPKNVDSDQKGLERLVLVNKEGRSEILRRKGDRILEIESVSLPHALELERRLQP